MSLRRKDDWDRALEESTRPEDLPQQNLPFPPDYNYGLIYTIPKHLLEHQLDATDDTPC